MKQGYQLIALLIIATFIFQEYDLSRDKVENKQPVKKLNVNLNSFNEDNSIEKSKIVNYRVARKLFWDKIYPNGGNTLYCREVFTSNHGQGINVDHVFPMSWVTKALDCGTRNQCRNKSELFNTIEADIHNLYPARTDVNKDRSSYRYGEVKGEQRQFGKNCDFEIDSNLRVAEPAKAVRGEIARSMFYMANKYKQHGLTIFSSQGRTLYQWHKSDPPNDSERSRNNLIGVIQGNRNPFIDDPQKLDDLVERGYFY